MTNNNKNIQDDKESRRSLLGECIKNYNLDPESEEHDYFFNEQHSMVNFLGE